MKYLYHYTSIHHLPKIMEDGYLKKTESNLRPDREMYKPCVWLTDLETIEDNGECCGLGGIADKTEIKITVKKHKSFKKWRKWSKENDINLRWAKILEKDKLPNTWWISEEIIKMHQIVKIENTKTGEVYYEKGK